MTIYSRLGPRLANRKGMWRGGGGTDREKEPPGHPAGARNTTLAGIRMKISKP